MTIITTENNQLSSVISTVFSVSAENAKKHLFFSVLAVNLGIGDAVLWLWGEDFGTTPNTLANAVQIPLEDYLPTRSTWQMPHKFSLPPNGKIIGYAVLQDQNSVDWHTWDDWFNPENWDNPDIKFSTENIVNISGTYAEVK